MSCSGGGSSNNEDSNSAFSPETLSVDLLSYVSSTLNYVGEASNEYVIPSSDNLTAFDSLVGLLLAQKFEQVSNTAGDLNFKLVQLTDTQNSNTQMYCLIEVALKGQGFYCINFNANKVHHISSPHPKHDSKTNTQAITLMRGMDAQYLSVATTHRCANTAASSCSGTTTACGSSGPFKVSDMAHNDNSYFQRFGQAVHDFNSGIYTLQLHGCGSGSCPSNGDNNDIFSRISAGTKTDLAATELVNKVSTQLNSDTSTFLQGTSLSCSNVTDTDKQLCGTTNTLGRYINGQSDPCTNSASQFTNSRWLHIEQNSNLRSDDGNGDLLTPNTLINTLNTVL